MEANHALFLPRLVPHVFDSRNNQRSPIPHNTMPRSDTPMSITSDRPTTSTLDQNDSTTIHFISALWEGNPDGAAAIFGHFQRSNPRGAVSALTALARGGREEREILCLLLLRLCEVDLVAADPLLAACLGQCLPSEFTSNASGLESATVGM